MKHLSRPVSRDPHDKSCESGLRADPVERMELFRKVFLVHFSVNRGIFSYSCRFPFWEVPFHSGHPSKEILNPPRSSEVWHQGN